MAARKRNRRKNEDNRPVVTDDFIYDDPEGMAPAGDSAAEDGPGGDRSVTSDTPEEAIRKLRGRKPAVSARSKDEPESAEEDSAPEAEGGEKRKVYSSGIMLDDDLQPIEEDKPRRSRKRHPVIRGIILGLVTVLLLSVIASYIFHRVAPNVPYLGLPENVVGNVVTPVQDFFSGLTETVFGYFRTLKLRANLENEYNALRAENEQLVYKAMLADELQQTLSQYEDLSDEISANINMKPIVCTVIGKSDSSYFSTLTINKGTADGVEDYMAVTISGALVGYTESTQAHKSTVRTVIDSDASIAALIQSSRDQGTVRGTLGVDGTPLCRMYYLPDDNLPRPGDLVVTSGVGMSFPKGIPIGVVRESTRGMDANKQYIVLEPQVDFQHLEYVIVLRYKPEAEAIEGRENGRTNVELVPLESARPSPVVPEIASSLFESQTTAPPASGEEGEEPEEEGQEGDILGGNAVEGVEQEDTPTPAPTDTLTPDPVPETTPDAGPAVTPLEYVVVNPQGEPTPTPTPSPAPTATPYFTPDPEDMIFEED